MKKYCQKEKVRNIAFLVVPSSTIESLDTFMYQLASYTVYIITREALHPILQMLNILKRINLQINCLQKIATNFAVLSGNSRTQQKERFRLILTSPKNLLPLSKILIPCQITLVKISTSMSELKNSILQWTKGGK